MLRSLAYRPELIGRTIYTREGGTFYAGPIEAIDIEDGDMIVIRTEWTAEAEDESGPWRLCNYSPNRISTRDDIGFANMVQDGSFSISIPYIGNARIDSAEATALSKPTV